MCASIRNQICLGAVGVLCSLGTPLIYAQGESQGRQQARAVRVDTGVVRVDGSLTESVWQDAPPVTEFTQL